MTASRRFQNFLVLLLVLVILGTNGIEFPKKKPKMIYCYFTVNATIRVNYRMEPEHIPADLCTHLGYGFFDVNEEGAISLQAMQAIHRGRNWINRVIDVKKRDPKLLVLAVVGSDHFKERSEFYKSMVNNTEKHDIFVDSTIRLLRRFNFDGLDMAWIIPVLENDDEIKCHFVKLVKKLKEALSARNLLLGISVSAMAKNYNVKALAKSVDFINVLTFNLGSPFFATFSSPLYGQGKFNVHDSLKYWVDKGAPNLKINMGISYYSMDLQLFHAEHNKPGHTTAKLLSEREYFDYCQELRSVTSTFHKPTGGIYWTRGNRWTSFENGQTLEMKYDYLLEKSLGGVAIYSLDADDIVPKCGEVFHLTKYTKRKLSGNFESHDGVSCSKTRGGRVCYTEYEIPKTKIKELADNMASNVPIRYQKV
ncbi:chitinase-3-like protein 2 [Haematobia irritans]|uniref:chitinase-3-like protein 2 n=1 Tax=Haematobia irritans TaxID=7368 RepID=UPI003F4FA1FD